MRWSSCSIAELADDLDHVAGDPVLDARARRPGSPRPRRLRRPPRAGERLRAAGRARVLEPVVEALVAVHRRRRRVELEDRLPEPVGEGVDGWTSVGQLGLPVMPALAPGRVAWATGQPSPDVRSAHRVRAAASAAGGQPAAGSQRGLRPPKSGICSPDRSMSGSRPMYGSRSSSRQLLGRGHARR